MEVGTGIAVSGAFMAVTSFAMMVVSRVWPKKASGNGCCASSPQIQQISAQVNKMAIMHEKTDTGGTPIWYFPQHVGVNMEAMLKEMRGMRSDFRVMYSQVQHYMKKGG
ncbi:MAG: hypothetical protein V3U60_16210 [Gammaproteobacteria bacterium]